MKSPFLQRIDTWNKLRKRGLPLPKGFAVPEKLYMKHQKKIRNRFENYCFSHGVAFRVYPKPSKFRQISFLE
jgi:hypothetical protein